VGVIGNAASAIQFVPQIAPTVKRLHVFQRSANWMIPRNDRPYTERERRQWARFPWLARDRLLVADPPRGSRILRAKGPRKGGRAGGREGGVSRRRERS